MASELIRLMRALIFDIETGPLPLTLLEKLLPPFDPEEVALGNLKDPVKIQAKIELARASHRERFISDAALAARTGCVLAIGYTNWEGTKPQAQVPSYLIYDRRAGGPIEDDPIRSWYGLNGEAALLTRFWAEVESQAGTRLLVGFNSNEFDLPFLYQRSLLHGVRFPALRRGRFWSDYAVDLKQVWSCGAKSSTSKGSLDEIARFLGVGGKTGSGAHFHELFRGDDPLERESSLEYLANDIDMTTRVADAMHQACPLDSHLRLDNPWFWRAPNRRLSESFRERANADAFGPLDFGAEDQPEETKTGHDSPP